MNLNLNLNLFTVSKTKNKLKSLYIEEVKKMFHADLAYIVILYLH
jgi:hypothetical protein